jgi:ABC-type branched-subunit amino acid transport system permease subunit
MLPALLILLVVVYSILPVIVDILFALIDVSPNIYYANLIKMLIGAIGLIMVIGVVWNLFTGLRGQPDYGQPQ